MVLRFIEQSLYLLPLGQRSNEFHVLADTHLTVANAQALAEATEACWRALLRQDQRGFGLSIRQVFDAQVAMFPNMITPTIRALIEEHRDRALGWKVSGAGGGGYLILVADQPIENAVRILIRREDNHGTRVP